MSMNLELLEPGSGVFHLRGTMNKSVLATIVGPAPAPSPRIVWQSIMNGLVIPSCIQIAHSTASHSPCCVLNLAWAMRAAGPFLSQGYGLSRTGMWAAATINTQGMKSLDCRRLLLHANSFDHCVPAYIQQGCPLH